MSRPGSPSPPDTPATWPRCRLGDGGQHQLAGIMCQCQQPNAIHWWCELGCGFRFTDHTCSLQEQWDTERLLLASDEECAHALWDVLYCAFGVSLGEYCTGCGLTERYHNSCTCEAQLRVPLRRRGAQLHDPSGGRGAPSRSSEEHACGPSVGANSAANEVIKYMVYVQGRRPAVIDISALHQPCEATEGAVKEELPAESAGCKRERGSLRSRSHAARTEEITQARPAAIAPSAQAGDSGESARNTCARPAAVGSNPSTLGKEWRAIPRPVLDGAVGASAAPANVVAADDYGGPIGVAWGQRRDASSAPRSTNANIGGHMPLYSVELQQQARGAATSAAARQVVPELGKTVELYNRDAAQGALDNLATGDAQHRLIAADPQLVGGLLASAYASQQRQQAAGTKKQDRSYWRIWARSLQTLFPGASPIRDDAEAALGLNLAGLKREVDAICAVLMYWLVTCPQYKPQSMMQRLRGVSRVHKKGLRLPFVSLSSAVACCKGVVQEHIDEHGPESLLTERKEPLENWMLNRWMTLKYGTKVGAYVVGNNLAWQGVRVLICYAATTGGRKADVALGAGVVWGMRHLSMDHCTWEFDGERTAAPTAEQLDEANLNSRTFTHLAPVCCKNDQDGQRWAGSPISSRYDAEQAVNFTREMAAYERMRRVPAAARRFTPLIVDASGKPWRKGKLATFFNLLLLAIMSAEKAKSYTFHSFRIYLACALMAAGASSETIKRMLRWASDEALRIYARTNVEETSRWVDLARGAQVNSVRTTTLREKHAEWPEKLAAEADAAEELAIQAEREREELLATHGREVDLGKGGEAEEWLDALGRHTAIAEATRSALEAAHAAIAAAEAVVCTTLPIVDSDFVAESAAMTDRARAADVSAIAPGDRPVESFDAQVAAISRDMGQMTQEARGADSARVHVGDDAAHAEGAYVPGDETELCSSGSDSESEGT